MAHIYIFLFIGLLSLLLATVEGKIIDLSWRFDKETQYHPVYRSNNVQWRLNVEHNRVWVGHGGIWLFYNSFGKTTEHGGTHMDAPMHMFDSKKRPDLWFMDQVPPERLVGPGVVIDVAEKAEKNRDYELTKEDVLAWERKNGKIPAGAIVLMHSGWEKYFKNTTAYFGTAKTNEVTHYPGFHANACRLLVERGVYGVGSDTASSDNGPSVDLPCHPILLGKNIWIMEMVANTGKLPAKGFTLFAMPMKIGEGSGAPTRMFAMFPSDLKPYSHSPKLLFTSFTLLLSMVFLLII